MKKSFVPISKQSKKAQKTYHFRTAFHLGNFETRQRGPCRTARHITGRNRKPMTEAAGNPPSIPPPLPFCPSLHINPTGSENTSS